MILMKVELQPPNATAAAVPAANGDLAITLIGNTYKIAALINTYSTIIVTAPIK